MRPFVGSTLMTTSSAFRRLMTTRTTTIRTGSSITRKLGPFSSRRAPPYWLFSTALGATIVSVTTSSSTSTTYPNSNNTTAAAVVACSPANDASTPPQSRTNEKVNGTKKESKPMANNSQQQDYFPEELLHHDHYNGITIHLEKLTAQTDSNSDEAESILDAANFEARLEAALVDWRAQGKKGIWIHCPVEQAHLVPIATKLGFDFHMVHDKKVLVLSQWLPPDVTNKLPLAPTHQVGVGCIVLCPWDTTQMLVVQEKTGPAAAYGLWKMPTGLSDPGEDLHDAAERELQEETGLTASCDSILVFRQAHSARSGTRASSDLFFVCQMTLELPEDFQVLLKTVGGSNDSRNGGEESTGSDATQQQLFEKSQQLFDACPDEIAAIRWMPVKEYCDQARWQTSPVMYQLNRVVLQATQQQKDQKDSSSDNALPLSIQHETLPLGFGLSKKATNTIYYPRQSNL